MCLFHVFVRVFRLHEIVIHRKGALAEGAFVPWRDLDLGFTSTPPDPAHDFKLGIGTSTFSLPTPRRDVLSQVLLGRTPPDLVEIAALGNSVQPRDLCMVLVAQHASS